MGWVEYGASTVTSRLASKHDLRHEVITCKGRTQMVIMICVVALGYREYTNILLSQSQSPNASH